MRKQRALVLDAIEGATQRASPSVPDTADSPTDSVPGLVKRPIITQGSLLSHISRGERLSKARQADIDGLLLKMMVSENLRHILLDSETFWLFVHALNPAYSVPDRSSFMTSHINKAYEIYKNNLTHRLQTSGLLSYTIDGMSTHAQVSHRTALGGTPLKTIPSMSCIRPT